MLIILEETTSSGSTNLNELTLSRSTTSVEEALKKNVDVLFDEISTEGDGLPGSILNTALSAGIEMDHSCGGVCACSTCHVIVRQGLDSCNEATDDEEDMLDLAPGLEPQSRLACQCVPDGSQDIIVEIPEWNRNLVSETH